jgi:hypothetical protein
MKLARTSLGAAALLAVLLKLFTYQFYFQDGPSTGLALRVVPSLTSQLTVDGANGAPDAVLVEDENDFVGGPAYRWTVSLGWWLLPAAWVALLIVARPTRRTDS